MVIRVDASLFRGPFPADRSSGDSGSLPVTLGKAYSCRLSVMVPGRTNLLPKLGLGHSASILKWPRRTSTLTATPKMDLV
jgi:hypothetical protein